MSTGTAPASPKKVLVVDDNEVILKTISLKLQGAGFTVITALDGSEAVAAARKETPDLILLDINFPPAVDGVPWDGFRIMDWFHRLDPAKKIPIIIITGMEDIGMKNKERATKAERWRSSTSLSTTMTCSRWCGRPWAERTSQPEIRLATLPASPHNSRPVFRKRA